jgi:hypothetical protein
MLRARRFVLLSIFAAGKLSKELRRPRISVIIVAILQLVARWDFWRPSITDKESPSRMIPAYKGFASL